VKDVVGLFVTAYNDKNVETPINLDDFHIENDSGDKIYSNDIVENTLSDHSDYHLKSGAYHRTTAVKAIVDNDSTKRCRNYGCNQRYDELDNGDLSCKHHTGPPIFHDTMKCWSCCRDRKAYDFEAFQQIQGCSIGRHSDIAPGVNIANSPSATSSAEKVVTPVAPQLKSIAAYNAANPEAASAAASAVKTLTRKSTRNDDGTARCQRKGCQLSFTVKDNKTDACKYHKGQPVFHDAQKYWSCCPNKKCFDFEEFLAVPGCGIGFHDDGVIVLVD
jgi:CHORD